MQKPVSSESATLPDTSATAPAVDALAKDLRSLPALDLGRVNWSWASAVVIADEPAKIALEAEEPIAPLTPNTSTEAATGVAMSGTTKRATENAITGATRNATSNAVVLSSSPSARDVPRTTESVVDGLLAVIRGAKKDLLIVSPYFVPGQDIMDALLKARQSKVRVRILTNSLASNDAPLAHAGYARHRKQLLQAGVELYEMLSTRAGMRSALGSGSTVSGSGVGSSRAMLHTKLLVIDGRLVIIGSMNLDMRSQFQNTEIAILIPSRTLSAQASQLVNDGLQGDAWQVQLDANQDLLWIAPKGSERENQSSEPDASLPLRIFLKLLGPLAPDHLL